MVDALTKLVKKMTCLENEFISIEVHNHQVLAPINIKLIKRHALKGEVSTTKENEGTN